MMLTPLTRKHSLRDLLLALGIGHFNATLIIPIMFTQPGTTDPKQPAVIMLVRQIQRNLIAMGAGIQPTGYLDRATAACITQLVGDESWINGTWSRVVNVVVAARDANVAFAPDADAGPLSVEGEAVDLGSADILPPVPGGALTYLAGGALLYYFWKKRKRSR